MQCALWFGKSDDDDDDDVDDVDDDDNDRQVVETKLVLKLMAKIHRLNCRP